MDDAFKPDSPVREPETAPYWDGAREGRLLIKQCDSCAITFHYPRTQCPFCLSDSSWIDTAGNGTIYSYSTVHAREGAYVLAWVTLAEGPSMLTNILTPDPTALQVGQAVRVDFIETKGEERLPVFVPV